MSVVEWRTIPGTDYSVSSAGQVRRGLRQPLTPRLHTNGYHRVSLGAGRDAYVHRLVAFAFHGPPPSPSAHADHIDGDRQNNSAANVRWLTPQENRARRNFARGERSGMARLTTDAVNAIRTSTAPAAELAALLGVAPRTVRDVRNGKTWSHVNG